MSQNKKPSEPVEEERQAELDKEVEYQLRQIILTMRALSDMEERQRKINRERNAEYRKTIITAIVFQSIAFAFMIASLITTVVKAAL